MENELCRTKVELLSYQKLGEKTIFIIKKIWFENIQFEASYKHGIKAGNFTRSLNTGF